MPVRESRSINMLRCSPASTANLPTAAKATRDVEGLDLAGERSAHTSARQPPYLRLGPNIGLAPSDAKRCPLLRRLAGTHPATTFTVCDRCYSKYVELRGSLCDSV